MIKYYPLLITLLLFTGCATISELDKLDLAAHVEKWLERSEPAAPAAPSTPAKSQTGDEIDLDAVTWYGPDIRDWPATSELPKGIYISGNMVNFPHTSAGKWQRNKDGKLEGNVWAIVNYNGKWRAASWEWLKPGQTSKPWTKIEQGHFKVGDLAGYQIKQGEEVYIIAAGLSRGNERGTKERTKATKVRW